MTPIETFGGERVAVFGLGGSGLSTLRALIEGGAEVAAWDDSEAARARASAYGYLVTDLAEADWRAFKALVLAVIGGLFVMEALSVVVQVASFKLTGKRVFRMAPIHHHFEQLGWSESQVVMRFWIIAFVLAMVGLATLKLR